MATKPKVEVIKRPVEQVGSNIKMTAWSAIMESIALIILGILFVVMPDTIVKVLAYIIGVFLVVKGGFEVISYFVVKGQNDFFNNTLLFGVVSILLGVAALLIGENIANVFRVIVGVLIIYESLVRINSATKLASVGIESWKIMLVIALVMLVLGIFITFNTGAVVTLIGWVMIATGIIGIVGDVVFIKYVNTVIDKITNKA